MQKEHINELVEKVVEDAGLQLVESKFIKESGRWVLRVFIYNSDNPVTHENCETITRKLADYLEEAIQEPYNLEVSSPGTERKLKSDREYNIFRGKRAKVKLKTGEVYTTEINDELIIKYKNGEVSSVKLEPEYKI